MILLPADYYNSMTESTNKNEPVKLTTPLKPEVEVPVIASSELPTGSYVRQLYEKLKNSMGLELDAKQFKDGWLWTDRKVFQPCKRVYSRLPSQLTEIKKPYLEIRESYRLLVLTTMTLGIAAVSRRCKCWIMQTTKATSRLPAT